MRDTSQKILLVESHYRSRSWFRALESLGDISVVSVMPEERKLFLALGVDEKNILNLNNFYCDDIRVDEASSYLAWAEKTFGFCYAEIVQMDRTLREKPRNYILSYGCYVLREFSKFVEGKDIRLVVIEPTWVHEILIVHVCKFLGIRLLAPVKEKLLPNRFFLFRGFTREIPFYRSESKSGVLMGRQLVNIVLADHRPQYFKKFEQRNKFRISKVVPLLDFTRLSLFNLKNPNIQPKYFRFLRRKFKDIVLGYYLRWRVAFINPNKLRMPFILVTMHVQPEAGIDVVGARFSNQYEFIRQISRTTPAGYRVVVKEHPHDFGRRDRLFYSKLIELGNVVLVSPDIDSRELIKRSSLVLSVAGTSSLEASILGTPAVTAVPMYFHRLLVRKFFDPYVDSVAELLIESEKWKSGFNLDLQIRILDEILGDSFVGNCMDLKTDSRVLDKKNIGHLRDAFQEVLLSSLTPNSP